MTGLEYALKATGLNKSGLADLLGLTRQRIGQLKHLPPEHCLTLHDKHGLDLSRLNPDIYPARIFK